MGLYIGVYYGLQESENAEKIRYEMDMLCAEIMEIKNDGEIILCMDANSKIGLMRESISRNGKLMLAVLQECNMIILNNTDKCQGTITRQNRKKESEKSAIDLVTATYGASRLIQSVVIDEHGEFRLRGKQDSDHNTILVKTNITGINTAAKIKIT